MSGLDRDIGLLRAFAALDAQRNVTRAAEQRGIGQPALSARLTRLRTLFGETLFTPSSTGRGVVPTARADQLDPLVRDLITRLHRLGEPVAFDPTTSERSEEHTSELQSLMRISYAVFCLKKKTKEPTTTYESTIRARIQQAHTITPKKQQEHKNIS